MILVPAWLVIRGGDASALSAQSPRRDSYFATKCWESFMERNNPTELHQHFGLENIPLIGALSEFYTLPIVTFSCTLNIPQDNVLFVMTVSYWYTYVCLYLTAGRAQTRRYTVCGHVPGEHSKAACAEHCIDIQPCLLVMSTNLFCPLCFRGKLLILTASLMKKKSYF